ncbi:hypothetical protein HOY80DRAFT_1046614 [Tuber brumale]|nr:hypothetical protein HOY80DRAFT_1046614 [Tuber brumale]
MKRRKCGNFIRQLLGIIEGVDKRKLSYRLKADHRWSRLDDEFSIGILALPGVDFPHYIYEQRLRNKDIEVLIKYLQNHCKEIVKLATEGSSINIQGLSGEDGGKDQPKTLAGGEGKGNIWKEEWPIDPVQGNGGQTGPFTTVGFEHYPELGSVGVGMEVPSPVSSKFSPWSNFSPSATSEPGEDYWSS